MARVQAAENFEILSEQTETGTYTFGGYEVTTQRDETEEQEITLRLLSPGEYEIIDVALARSDQGCYRFTVRVCEPEGSSSKGLIEVEVYVVEGGTTQILYTCDYSRRLNVPGALVQERIEAEGRIVPSLQISEGPPRRRGP